jgi:carbonic anhydrase/acetyltransferase-like protein (isoleucine patch superfamily)
MAHIGHGVSIWPYVVTRAEMHETIIGENCPITHRAVLHGCMIGDRVLIRVGATVMDGAVIGNNPIVAGHPIVTEGNPSAGAV